MTAASHTAGAATQIGTPDGARAHEHAQGKEQGVAGQEEADQQAGLGEDDQGHTQDGPGPTQLTKLLMM